jgi:hypothetical protein
MALDNQQRRLLRNEMTGAFDRPSLDLFLQDWLNVELDLVVATGKSFEMECQLVITWAERNGQLMPFLKAVQTQHGKATFRDFASGLLTTLTTTVIATGGQSRPFMVGTRPVLNRNGFWKHLADLANGVPTCGRVLVVNGGVGKSYSRWPVSHICDPSRHETRMVRVEANGGKILDITAMSLANAIATRMWGANSLADTDDLAQAARIGKDLAAMLISRLSAIQEKTWLLIDELNLVNLDATATELLCKLCNAIDARECPNVWLFLIGLDPLKLGPHVAPYVCRDQVLRPRREDIEEFVRWFARAAGKPDDPVALKPTIDDLDVSLPENPNHDHWTSFHEKLTEKCEGIRQGTLP